MGAVALLHPQDVLKRRLPHNRRPFRSSTNHLIKSPRPTPNTGSNPNRPHDKINGSSPSPSPSPSTPKTSTFSTATNPVNLVMGKVQILKRGQVLPNNNNNKKTVSFDLNNQVHNNKVTERQNENQEQDFDVPVLGLEPELVPNHSSMADFYAGSAFVTSPPPSSLPLPAFFKKKTPGVLTDSNGDDDEAASSDLRRLLKLDF